MPQSIKTTLTGNEQVQIVIDPDTGVTAVTNVTSIGGNTSQLELITEGGNTGWRILGRDPANYGDIGIGAIDISYNAVPSATHGATGTYSFAANSSTTASGALSTVFGSGSTASGSVSFATGTNTVASGDKSFATGQDVVASGDNSFASGWFGQANSFSAAVFGTYPIVDAGQTLDSFVATDLLYKIGNGTGLGSESDAFVVLKNGTITAPSMSTAEITAAGNSALITKEYGDANYLDASNVFADDVFRVQDNADDTKQIAFEASGITTATTRTLTVQDSDGTLAYLSDIPTDTHIGSENKTIPSSTNRILYISANGYLTLSQTTSNTSAFRILGDTTQTSADISNSNTTAGARAAKLSSTSTDSTETLHIEKNTASTNAVTTAVELAALSTAGGSAAGFGVGISFTLETATNGQSDTVATLAYVGDVTTDNLSEGHYSFKAVHQGTTPNDIFIISSNNTFNLTGVTAATATALTAVEGMVVRVTSTDATFTSIGYWAYENSTWVKW